MSIIVGMFGSSDQGEEAIDQLVQAGVQEGSIHPITRQRLERTDQRAMSVLTRAVGFGTGVVSNELTRLGLGTEEAAFYEEELADRGMLIAVETDGENEEAILRLLRDADATVRED
jgi:NAD(P)H-dependent flavin oxidoreductase YrpB (nitropropane dioxygenase family)